MRSGSRKASLLRDHPPRSPRPAAIHECERILAPRPEKVNPAFDRIARMIPELAERAHKELIELAKNVAAAPQETYVPRRLPAEVRRLLAPRPRDVRPDERLVAHVLRDL